MEAEPGRGGVQGGGRRGRLITLPVPNVTLSFTNTP